MKNYGDLALVDGETGALLPLFWNSSDNTDPFKEPVSAIAKLLASGKVTQVFKLEFNRRAYQACQQRPVPNLLPCSPEC
jgi:hypothetical protein